MIKFIKLIDDNRGLAFSCLKEKGMWGNAEHMDSLSFTYDRMEGFFSAFAAIYDSEPAGHAMVIETKPPFSPVESENSLFINCLYVGPSFRKMGIGSKLLEYLEKDAEESGRDMIFVQSVGNEWMKKDFFAERGYRQIDDEEISFLLMKKISRLAKFSPVKTVSSNSDRSKDSLVINYNPLCPVLVSHYRQFAAMIKKEIPGITIKENYVSCDDDICKNGSFGIYFNNTPILINQRRISETVEIIRSLRKSP